MSDLAAPTAWSDDHTAALVEGVECGIPLGLIGLSLGRTFASVRRKYRSLRDDGLCPPALTVDAGASNIPDDPLLRDAWRVLTLRGMDVDERIDWMRDDPLLFFIGALSRQPHKNARDPHKVDLKMPYSMMASFPDSDSDSPESFRVTFDLGRRRFVPLGSAPAE